MHYVRTVYHCVSPVTYGNGLYATGYVSVAHQNTPVEHIHPFTEHMIDDVFGHGYDVERFSLNSFEKAVCVDEAKAACESIGRLPGALAAVKTITQMTVRAAAVPVQTVLLLNILKNMPLPSAWKKVKENPYAGTKKIVVSIAIESSAILLTHELYKKLLIEQQCFANDKTSDRVASLMAAITGTCMSAPLMTLATREQLNGGSSNTKILKGNIRETMKEVRLLYRGVTPAALKNVCSWTIGLSLGNYFDENLRGLLGDTVTTKVTAKTAGWMVGSFIGAPFLNMQLEMRTDPEMKSMVHVLRKMNVIFDPVTYSAENFKVKSVFVRLVMGMPLEQEIITVKEKGKCRVYSAIKNAPKLWRGALSATPLTAIAGTAVSVGFLVAEKLFAPSEKQ